MKFLVGCFLSAFLVCMFFCSYAQTGNSSINGKVLTEDHASAQGATITLLSTPDSSAIKSTACNQTGHFEFDGLKPGIYIVFVHKIGYLNFYTHRYQVTANEDIDADEIVLHSAPNQLNEVAVTAKRDYIEVRPDKTVLNVDRSILASGNSVYDVLSTAPGVRIVDDQILLKGGQKALIAINGKAVGQLNDEQLTDLLKSYQSSMISQIELIENPSAKYDAAGGGGVINIILKKSKDIGFKANITESAAFGQDYKLNSSLNLNYRTQKFNFFGSYSFADNKTPRELDIDRITGKNSFDVNYKSTSLVKNNSFNVGTDYSLGPKQTIGALFYGYSNNIGIDKNNTTNIETNEQLDSNITTQSHIDRNITNLNYNLNYKGSFGKEDKTSLSADVDYSTYRRKSTELLQNDFYDANWQPYRDPLFYKDRSPSQIDVRSENIDFSQVLSKTGTLNAGIKNSQVKSNNMIDFEQGLNRDDDFTPVPLLTDHFVYSERVDAGYVNYTDKFNKTSLAIGMRAEQTNSNGKSLNPDRTTIRSYFDLFPNFQVMQALDADNKLTVNYNRRITRPNYQDLNPFVAYIDEYSYSTGNPFLRPEYINTYQVSDLYKDKYKAALSMVITKDFFVPVFEQDDATKVYTTTTSNIGTRYEYNAEFNLPVDINKWWSASVYLFASYERFIYNSDSVRKSTYDIIIQATQNFAITNSLNAEVYGSWESPTYYGIKQYDAQWSVRAGISQAVLHNKGSIRLAVSDIFNSDAYRYNSHYLNLNLTGHEKSGTRFVTATFTYRFGNQSVKNARRRIGGNADDQRRLSGSSNEN